MPPPSPSKTEGAKASGIDRYEKLMGRTIKTPDKDNKPANSTETTPLIELEEVEQVNVSMPDAEKDEHEKAIEATNALNKARSSNSINSCGDGETNEIGAAVFRSPSKQMRMSHMSDYELGDSKADLLTDSPRIDEEDLFAMDEDGDGEISREEYIARFGDATGFDRLDVDGDGTISAEEVQEAAKYHRKAPKKRIKGWLLQHCSWLQSIPCLTEGYLMKKAQNHLYEAFATIDLDGEGSIEEEELLAVMKSFDTSGKTNELKLHGLLCQLGLKTDAEKRWAELCLRQLLEDDGQPVENTQWYHDNLPVDVLMKKGLRALGISQEEFDGKVKEYTEDPKNKLTEAFWCPDLLDHDEEDSDISLQFGDFCDILMPFFPWYNEGGWFKDVCQFPMFYTVLRCFILFMALIVVVLFLWFGGFLSKPPGFSNQYYPTPLGDGNGQTCLNLASAWGYDGKKPAVKGAALSPHSIVYFNNTAPGPPPGPKPVLGQLPAKKPLTPAQNEAEISAQYAQQTDRQRDPADEEGYWIWAEGLLYVRPPAVMFAASLGNLSPDFCRAPLLYTPPAICDDRPHSHNCLQGTMDNMLAEMKKIGVKPFPVGLFAYKTPHRDYIFERIEEGSNDFYLMPKGSSHEWAVAGLVIVDILIVFLIGAGTFYGSIKFALYKFSATLQDLIMLRPYQAYIALNRFYQDDSHPEGKYRGYKCGLTDIQNPASWPRTIRILHETDNGVDMKGFMKACDFFSKTTPFLEDDPPPFLYDEDGIDMGPDLEAPLTRSLHKQWMGKEGSRRLYYIKLFVDVVNGVQKNEKVDSTGIVNCLQKLFGQTFFIFALPLPTFVLWFMLNKGFSVYGTSFGPTEAVLKVVHWVSIFQVLIMILNVFVTCRMYLISFHLDRSAEYCEFYFFSPRHDRFKQLTYLATILTLIQLFIFSSLLAQLICAMGLGVAIDFASNISPFTGCVGLIYQSLTMFAGLKVALAAVQQIMEKFKKMVETIKIAALDGLHNLEKSMQETTQQLESQIEGAMTSKPADESDSTAMRELRESLYHGSNSLDGAIEAFLEKHGMSMGAIGSAVIFAAASLMLVLIFIGLGVLASGREGAATSSIAAGLSVAATVGVGANFNKGKDKNSAGMSVLGHVWHEVEDLVSGVLHEMLSGVAGKGGMVETLKKALAEGDKATDEWVNSDVELLQAAAKTSKNVIKRAKTSLDEVVAALPELEEKKKKKKEKKGKKDAKKKK